MATSYEKRLQIPLEGNSLTEFTTKSGLHIATGYTRIVIGGRGPYIEFTTDMMINNHMHIPDNQLYRFNDMRVYYIEYRTNNDDNVKIYKQLKTVSYADYKIGMWYISPFDLLADGKVIIEKLRKGGSYVQL